MSNVSLLTQDLWSALAAESARSTGVVAAVAYITNVDDLRFGANDILVVDASPEAIQFGKTSALVLEYLFDQGVRLYSSANLHAKVYVFTNSAIVGSPNLSSSSRNALIECAILSRDSTLIVEARSWIERLASRSVPVDREFINRAKAIVIERNEAETSHQAGAAALWYLAVSPNALTKNMRAYFVALVIAQLGALHAEQSFWLWPNADFRQHENEGRLRRAGERYLLTQQGVEYFSQPRQRPKDDLLQLFLAAVRTGIGTALPVDTDTKMLPLPEA